MRVVVVVVAVVVGGLLGGHDLRGRPGEGQLFWMSNILFVSHPKISLVWDPLEDLLLPAPYLSLEWDPSGSSKIFCSLTRFFFGVGSVRIDQDMSLPDPISLRGGIYSFH